MAVGWRSLRQHSSWLWLAGGCLAVALISILSIPSEVQKPPLSVRSAQPDGALAAYLWLARIGYRTRVETSLDLSALRPDQGSLLLLSPDTADLPEAQARHVLSWVRAGGHLVLGTDGVANANLLRSLGISAAAVAPAPIELRQPLLLAPPTTQLAGEAAVALKSSAGGTVMASTMFGPALLLQREGRGRIWILTAPQLLDNAHIAHADNRRLLLNLVGPPVRVATFLEPGASLAPAPAGRPDWLTGTTWGIALLFALAFVVLYRGLSGIRLGPPVIPLAERHRPAAEYVVSLAGLLRRAHSRTAVLERYQHGLRRSITQRYGADDLDLLEPGDRARAESLLAPETRLSETGLLRRAKDIVEFEEELRRNRV